MGKFRKKPEVVEAIRFERGTARFDALAVLVPGRLELELTADPHFLRVATLEGIMTAEYGDWIVKGANDECFPMTDGEFTKTYEPVEE